MKKICFLCPWMHVEGGLQRVASNLANALSEKYNVTLCVISVNTDEPFYRLNSNITVEYLPEAAFASSGIVRRIIGKVLNNTKTISFISERVYYPRARIQKLQKYLEYRCFDCVIGLSGDINMLLACVDRKNIQGKLIGWQHNSIEDYFERKGYYYYGRKKLAFRLYARLDYLVTLTSKDAKRYSSESSIRSINIYNPLTFQLEKLERKSLNQLLFVGRLDWEQKGLGYLTEVLKIVFSDPISDGWRIVIVGDGKDRKRLEKALISLQICDRVEFKGRQESVTSFYQNADILLNTSAWEGFGLVLTEAMECGLPVVSFETDGPSEIIDSGSNGFLISKYDVQSFGIRVLQLMQDKPLRDNFSVNARNTAKRFDKKSITNQWIGLIEEIK